MAPVFCFFLKPFYVIILCIILFLLQDTFKLKYLIQFLVAVSLE